MTGWFYRFFFLLAWWQGVGDGEFDDHPLGSLGTPLVGLDRKSEKSNLTHGYQAPFSTFWTCLSEIYKVCTSQNLFLELRNVIKVYYTPCKTFAISILLKGLCHGYFYVLGTIYSQIKTRSFFVYTKWSQNSKQKTWSEFLKREQNMISL